MELQAPASALTPGAELAADMGWDDEASKTKPGAMEQLRVMETLRGKFQTRKDGFDLRDKQRM